jgi:type IV pilus assembly protein PilX
MVHRQDGITMVMALLMMIVVMLMGASAAQLALQGEKAARGERDRQLAFQAAEDALADAEHDISGTAGSGGAAAGAGRSAMFGADAGPVFAANCGAGAGGGGAGGGSDDAFAGPGQGLLAHADGNAAPAWQSVDLSGAEDGGLCSVPYGAYTAAAMQTGQGFQPFQRPRYVIERMLCHLPGEDAAATAAPQYCYRITVIGFGARPGTEVVLQTVFRKAE